MRNRHWIVGIWVALALFGFYANANINSLLTTSITVPGSPSAIADAKVRSAFGENTEGAFSIFLQYDKKSPKSDVEALKAKVNQAISELPGSHVAQLKAFDGVLYANLQTEYSLQKAAELTPDLRSLLTNTGIKAKVSGPPAIKYDASPVLQKDLERGQLVAILIALFFLLITLRSIWSMLIPIIVSITTISTSIGVIYLLAHKMLMVLYIPNIVELIGLGLAIDFSLLMVHRYKLDGDIQKTRQTILISGSTVAIAMATLILVPVPFIRSLGIAGIVVPLVAMLSATTLQPALLSYLGTEGRAPNFGQDHFRKLGEFVIKRPIIVLLSSLAILVVPILQLGLLHVTPSSLSALPANLESSEAIKIVTSRAGEGIISPIQVLVSLPAASDVNSQRISLAGKISEHPDVFAVATDKKYADASGENLRLFVISKRDLGQNQRLISFLRALPNDFPAGTKIYIAGAPAQGVDLVNAIKNSFPSIALFALLISYVLLRRFLQSLLIPLKALLLDLISLAAAVGVTVFITRNYFYLLPAIEIWTLLFVFAVLFGLSMDYEVFIVSRIRESYVEHGDNNRAIVDGLAQTGGVVTTAAFIMVGALTGFITGHFAGLQELGIGLVAGIAIDATVIRLLLLPATMVLLGKWNWSHPRIRGSRTNLS